MHIHVYTCSMCMYSVHDKEGKAKICTQDSFFLHVHVYTECKYLLHVAVTDEIHRTWLIDDTCPVAYSITSLYQLSGRNRICYFRRTLLHGVAKVYRQLCT